ncbi:unnamed protein product [Rotaria sordida]|uniref:Uncharacterized protein n=1 Tax=Rotaria sordida TaxID=392033 RepID=A0A813XDK8_9BILA|nr:unnamed protein product [Rotaria sordida]
MAKFLVLIVLVVCVTLASCHRGPSRGFGGNRGPGNGGQDRQRNWNRTNGNGDQDRLMTKVCANNSLAQSYLAQNRQLITSLRSNASLAQAIKNRQNFIDFIEDDDNTDLLSSNCTAFFTGRRNARKLDRDTLKQQRRLDQSVGWSFFKIDRSIVGNNSS